MFAFIEGVECDGERLVCDVKCDRHTLLHAVDYDTSVSHHSIRPAEVLQSSHDRNAGGIGNVSIVVDNVNVGPDRPAAHAL